MKEVLRVARGLQLFDQTKQLEPSGWLPGMEGIYADIQTAGKI